MVCFDRGSKLVTKELKNFFIEVIKRSSKWLVEAQFAEVALGQAQWVKQNVAMQYQDFASPTGVQMTTRPDLLLPMTVQ
jgi:hypothetical protein